LFENKFDFYVNFTTVEVLVIDFLAFIEKQKWGQFVVIWSKKWQVEGRLEFLEFAICHM
jgi:hypothetical protein